MRKLRWLDITDIDTQHCLMAFNERVEEIGIREEDIVSVQYVFNEKPCDIDHGDGRKQKAWVTLFIFYWSDR